MQIVVELASALTAELRGSLQSSIDREFGQIEIVRAHRWAEPTWVVLGYDDDRLVSSLAVVDRHATADDQPLHLMGLSNVITEPAGRGRGYSRRLNAAALELMARQDPASLGMLFCADSLVSFYASLGWQPFRGSVMVSQPAGDRLWSSNCMVHTLGQQRSVAFQQVHLRGLPW